MGNSRINGSRQHALKPSVSSLTYENSTLLYCMGRVWPGNVYKKRKKLISLLPLETKRSLRDAVNDMYCVTPVTNLTEAYNKVSRYYRYLSNLS